MDGIMRGGITPVSDESIARAARIVAGGGLVVIPTDTIYGIACDPRNPEAVARLYAAKKRPRSKSLQVLLGSTKDIEPAGLILPSVLKPLTDAFLPGALSPVCPATPACTFVTVRTDNNGTRTQEVRVPDSDVVRRLVAAFGPLACSSANISGQPSAVTAHDAAAQLGNSVSLYLDGGPAPGGLPSTIVAADPTAPDGVTVLRGGVLGEAAVRATLRAAHATSVTDGETRA